MKHYAVVLDRTETGYGAWVPDLPGCVAAARTLEETQRLIREAIPLHVESLLRNGESVPPPTTRIEYVQTPATVGR